MKRLIILFLMAGFCLGASTSAQAVDFNAKGQWLMGFAGGDGSLISHTRNNGTRTQANTNDKFVAEQRIRLQLDAVASEALSGTVYFEIGDTTWGKSSQGGALGADGTIVELKRAYLDWTVPDTTMRVRMGIQGVVLPNAAGATAIMDSDLAGISVGAELTDTLGLTFFWGRPFNDNYQARPGERANTNHTNYLDNLDLFMLGMPFKGEGIGITPWVMYGLVGKNALRDNEENGSNTFSDTWHRSFLNDYIDRGWATSSVTNRKDQDYTSAFWAGLPVKLSLFDPLNIELDLNYGYFGGYGRGTMTKSGGVSKRFDTQSEGWLAKALIEYRFDWGTPGIFGWYASGDDGNPANGSERLPAIEPVGNFTSFFGDGNWGWAPSGSFYDRALAYGGTWGIGLQVSNVSFVESLKHTLRVAYRGGTNNPGMAKYAREPWGWGSGTDGVGQTNDVYLTTNDGLLEFNLINAYKPYENLEINLELGYVVNCIDQDTWKKANRADGFDKQDAWKAQLIFAYTF